MADPTTTDDYRGLLAGVLADPAADLPRLVLADYLEENGDGDRAAFIRVQCEIAQLPPHINVRRPCPHEFALRVRERGLVCRFLGITQSLPDSFTVSNDPTQAVGEIPHATTTRGFVSEVRLTLAAFLEHAPALFAAHPITTVTLSDAEPVSDSEYSGGFVWATDEAPLSPNVNHDPGWWLPPALFAGLEGFDRKASPWERMAARGSTRQYAIYGDPGDANAALSSACVAYGRELAGLTALAPNPPELIPWYVPS